MVSAPGRTPVWTSSRVEANRKGRAGPPSSTSSSSSVSSVSSSHSVAIAASHQAHPSQRHTSAASQWAGSSSNALPNLSSSSASSHSGVSSNGSHTSHHAAPANSSMHRPFPFAASSGNPVDAAKEIRDLHASPHPSASQVASPRHRDLTRGLGGTLDPMSLIASPSRGIQSHHATSLGAAAEQDLTNFQTQQKYRQYITRRISSHCQKFSTLSLDDLMPRILVPGEETETMNPAGDEKRMAKVSLDEILLLVRKLREGIMASHRMDAATIEVYHLSLFLSIFTLHPAQISSTINRLVLDLYASIPCTTSIHDGPTWTGDIREDFASNAAYRDDALVSQLHLFATDSPENRAHHASLLLLAHTCLGSGGALGSKTVDPSSNSNASLSDNFLTLKHKILASLRLPLDGPPNGDIFLAESADRAVRTGDVLLFRSLLSVTKKLKGGRGYRPSAWQKLLLEQAASKVRLRAYNRLRSAYMSVPLPGVSQTGKEHWLEEMLLIDARLAPFQPQAKLTTIESKLPPAHGKVPEAWDEEDLGQLNISTSPFCSTELTTSTNRLAAIFTQQALPRDSQRPSPSAVAHDNEDIVSRALHPWKERLIFSRMEEGNVKACAIKLR